MTSPEVLLVYDRECPLCEAYCRMVRIRQSAGELRLVNAREDAKVLAEVTRLGFDIDQGMVLKMDGALYYGADAIHSLSLLSTASGLFNRINFWIFSLRARSRFLYPVLRGGRNLLLKILGTRKINNLRRSGNDRF